MESAKHDIRNNIFAEIGKCYDIISCCGNYLNFMMILNEQYFVSRRFYCEKINKKNEELKLRLRPETDDLQGTARCSI